MNEMSFYVGVEVLAIGFETLLIYYWARIFSDGGEKNRKLIFLINVLIFSVISIATLFLRNPMSLIIITFVCVALELIFQVNKIGGSIFLAFIFCVFAAISDALVGFSLTALIDKSLDVVILSEKYRAYGLIVTKLIMLMFIGFAYSYTKRYEMFKISSAKTIIYFVILPMTSILILNQMSRYAYISNVVDSWMNILGILGLIVANISVFIFFEKDQILKDQKIKENIMEVQIQSQKEYYSEMEKNAKEIRQISHDIKSRLTVLSGYAEVEDINAIKKYLGKIQEDVKDFVPVIYTGYPGIDSLITEKISLAEAKCIKFKRKLMLSKDLKVDEMDLCILIGNLLNNALEACEKVEKNKRAIYFEMKEDGVSLSICIKNSIAEQNNQGKNILLQTTKKDKINHGFGMLTIQKIVQKYKGIFEWEIENENFIVDIILFF